MSSHPSPGPSARHKQPLIPVGITAGAEDAKYQTKYRELKRKVKEIENDNDKLHFKVLQAKRSIQRMKLERAILYERLAGPPSPNDPQNRHITPMGLPSSGPVPPPFSRSHSGTHQYQDHGDIPHENNEYVISHERPRIQSGPDGRPVMPQAAPGATRLHSPPRRTSGESRHMPPPGPTIHASSRPHISPTMHHSRSASSHERTASHSSRSRAHQQPYVSGHPHQYPEGLPPSQQQVLHSPPIRERNVTRRYDIPEGPHNDPHQHSRLSSFMPRLSPPPDTRRVHSHQRMSPGPPSRDEYERQRDRELEHERNHPRDLGRNRDLNSMASPPIGHRSRQTFDRSDHPESLGSSRMRDEPVYYDAPPAAGGYPPHSRSGSPVSGSGSGNGNGALGDASRPDSRHFYEPQERTRPYKLRPVNPPNEEMDFVHEDGRSRDRGGFDSSRKRGRDDMEVDDDAGDYPTGRAPEDRGKRYHREHRRSIDNQDDGRMGPP